MAGNIGSNFDGYENLGPLPKTFEANSYYRVQLREPVQMWGQTFSPAEKNKFTGAVCEKIRDKIVSCDKEV